MYDNRVHSGECEIVRRYKIIKMKSVKKITLKKLLRETKKLNKFTEIQFISHLIFMKP